MAIQDRILILLEYVPVPPLGTSPGQHKLRIRAVPDVAVVKVGTKVLWSVEKTVRVAFQAMRWDVYFQKGSPFRYFLGTASIVTQGTDQQGNSGLIHAGEFEPFVADQPGDYKYGLRVSDASNYTPISDEDPRLVVV